MKVKEGKRKSDKREARRQKGGIGREKKVRGEG